jgi:hypothetical protein
MKRVVMLNMDHIKRTESLKFTYQTPALLLKLSGRFYRNIYLKEGACE